MTAHTNKRKPCDGGLDVSWLYLKPTEGVRSAHDRYPEFYRSNRPLSLASYRTVRCVLLDFIQARRHAPAGFDEAENRDVARAGLVRTRYAYYAIGALSPDLTI